MNFLRKKAEFLKTRGLIITLAIIISFIAVACLLTFIKNNLQEAATINFVLRFFVIFCLFYLVSYFVVSFDEKNSEKISRRRKVRQFEKEWQDDKQYTSSASVGASSISLLEGEELCDALLPEDVAKT